nr:cell wall protein IFF6-like [Megalopta genalis]
MANMMKSSLTVLLLVGLVALPTEIAALQCYECESEVGKGCDVVTEKTEVATCGKESSTTVTPTSTDSTGGTPTNTDSTGGTPTNTGPSAGTPTTTDSTGGTPTNTAGSPSSSDSTAGSPSSSDSTAGSGENGSRRRRSLLNRLAEAQPFEDVKYRCYKKSVTQNNKTTITRGCMKESDAENCKDCSFCDSDKCNSATSVAVYASMIISLVTFIFLTQ